MIILQKIGNYLAKSNKNPNILQDVIFFKFLAIFHFPPQLQ